MTRIGDDRRERRATTTRSMRTSFASATGSTIDDDTLEQRLERDRAQIDLHATHFDLRQIEHVVHDAKQMIRRGANPVVRAAKLRRHFAVEPRERERVVADDRVERRAQLVRHVREKSTLRLVRFFHLLRAFLESHVRVEQIARQQLEIERVHRDALGARVLAEHEQQDDEQSDEPTIHMTTRAARGWNTPMGTSSCQ